MDRLTVAVLLEDFILACTCQSHREVLNTLAGFKKASRGFSVEAPKAHSGPFSGRFRSDSGGLTGCNSDFWPVTLTFDLSL